MSAKVRKATAAEPIGFAKILNQCMEQLDAYAEVCTAPKQTISRAWWIVGLARALSDEGWHVRTEPDPGIAFPHLWGKGFAIPSPDQLPTFDLIAWPSWSDDAPDGEKFGHDERELPPLYVLRLVLDHYRTIGEPSYAELWKQFTTIGKHIKGPLTASLVMINRIQGAEAWSTAQNFRYLEKLRAKVEVSTQMGEMPMGHYVYSPLDKFQLFMASRSWRRALLRNPDFVPRRISRRGFKQDDA